MEKKLLAIIKQEDKKNALSDTEISEKLLISRYDVIKLRKKLNIPDYSSRRLPYLKENIVEILKKNKHVSSVELTKLIEEDGFNVSRFLVTRLKEEISKELFENDCIGDTEKVVKCKVCESEKKQSNSIIEKIIGAKGSIEFQISQAIAAVMYPPNGLHTLILGQTGTGKSFLAEIMYKIAVESGRISKDSRLIRLNCADYSDNPQLLLSQLFGYVKGAFTGAVIDKAGLIEKANDGILFLDEIHRLPLEGQEILFSVMDSGKYRKLGQTDNEEKVNVMIIGATTEDDNSHLLATFRRRIPMIIELPPLSKRTIHERYDIIVNFLKIEAHRIGLEIHLKSEALGALLLYDCMGNIGQLKSDIQVACATDYLRYLNENNKHISLDVSDFNINVQQGLLRKKYSNDEVNKYFNQGIVIMPEENEITFLDEKELYIFPNNIYKYIEKRYETLKKQGIPQKLVYNIVGKEIDIKLERTAKYISLNSNNNSERINISKIVGKDIAETVVSMVELAEIDLGPLNKSLVYSLSLHLCESIHRIKESKPILCPKLEEIKQTYILEYETARKMIKLAERMLVVKFPEDEIGFVSMYLKNNIDSFVKLNNKVKIIIITHGNVAEEMAKVANKIIGYEVVHYVCMPLDENPKFALKRAIELAKKINEDGILILVDMGSLLTFGELITKESGIPTKTIERVDVAMVLEVAIKAENGDTSLSELYDIVKKQNTYIGYMRRPEDSNKKKVIVTLCITGEGAALGIKKLIEDTLPEVSRNEIEIIPLGIIGNGTDEYIKKIHANKEVIAIIGTIDPRIENIKFFPVERIMDVIGIEELKQLIKNKIKMQILNMGTINIIDQKLIIPNAVFSTKEEVLNSLATLLEKQGYVKDNYITSLYEREAQMPTIFVNGIAIPHTYPKYIIKPGIAIAILKKPVKWTEDYLADIIFMLALGYNNKPVLKYIYKISKDIEILKKIRDCRDAEEIASYLTEGFHQCIN